MNPDRIRLSVEVIGITALVLSLLFVGLELKQTRDMSLAELQHNRLVLFHTTMLAALESESALVHYGKNIYTEKNGVLWTSAELNEKERAAALLLADAQLASWEIETRFIELGFAIRTFEDLESEIGTVMARNSALSAVWPLWRYPGDEVNSFHRMMIRILPGQ